MWIDNRFGLVALLLTVVAFGSYAVPYAYSKGVSQFTLYGNVIDGSTCLPITNALVTAPYNSNTSNLTNSTGGYLLRLGYGNWTVSISKNGYTSISFNTPYVATGSYQFNTYLLAPGSTAANCTLNRHAANSTVPTTAVTTTPPTSTGSSQQTTISTQGSQNGQKSSNTALLAGVGIIIVIIIIALAYFGLKGRSSEDKKEEKKEEPKKADETKG